MADRTWWMGVLSSLEQLLKQVLNLEIFKMKSSKEPIFKDQKFKETMKPHINCRFCVVVCFLVVYFLECTWGISTFVSLWQWSFTEPSETNSVVPRSMAPPGRSTSRWGYFCWGCFACASTDTIKVHSCFILTWEVQHPYMSFPDICGLRIFAPQGISSAGKLALRISPIKSINVIRTLLLWFTWLVFLSLEERDYSNSQDGDPWHIWFGSSSCLFVKNLWVVFWVSWGTEYYLSSHRPTNKMV